MECKTEGDSHDPGSRGDKGGEWFDAGDVDTWIPEFSCIPGSEDGECIQRISIQSADPHRVLYTHLLIFVLTCSRNYKHDHFTDRKTEGESN